MPFGTAPWRVLAVALAIVPIVAHAQGFVCADVTVRGKEEAVAYSKAIIARCPPNSIIQISGQEQYRFAMQVMLCAPDMPIHDVGGTTSCIYMHFNPPGGAQRKAR